MNRYFKTEGNILYPSKDDHNRPMLTWGPFYYHNKENGKIQMGNIEKYIIDWVNEQDKSLNIKPENYIVCSGGNMVVFKIKAWKDEQTLQDCDAIITVDDIFFEDEQK